MANANEGARRLFVLGLLLEGRMHGYRINEYLTHVIGSGSAPRRSAVYYTLDALERQGYVGYELEREGKRPERRMYGIKEDGKEHFERLLREQLGGFASTYYPDDASAVFLDRMPVTEARDLLNRKRGKVVTALQGILSHPDGPSGWQRLIARNVAHLEAELSWVDGMLEELGGGSGPVSTQ